MAEVLIGHSSGATFDGLRQPSQGFFRTKHGIQFADREGFGLFQKVPPRLSSRRFPAVMLKTPICPVLLESWVLSSSFHEKPYNHGSVHTTPCHVLVPTGQVASVALAPAAKASLDAR